MRAALAIVSPKNAATLYVIVIVKFLVRSNADRPTPVNFQLL